MKNVKFLLGFLLCIYPFCIITASEKQLFILKKNDHEVLEKYCETYREHCSDKRVAHLQFMNFSDCQPWVNAANIKRLIYYVRNSDKLHEITNNQQLIQLFSLAEYWQAPKSFVCLCLRKCEMQLEDQLIVENKAILQRIGNQLYSCGEFLKNFPAAVNQQETQASLPVGNPEFRIRSLDGITLLANSCRFSTLYQLTITDHQISDFNLAELKSLLPYLKRLILRNNKISILKRHHVLGMDQNFYLDLEQNPIVYMDSDCFDQTIIAEATGSTIALGYTLTQSKA